MSIRQTKKQSDLEKRLQLLRRQVYGKGSEKSAYQYTSESTDQKVKSSTPANRPADILIHRPSDLTYLNQDLLKILIFSSLAISAQIGLFFLSKNQILNLNFF